MEKPYICKRLCFNSYFNFRALSLGFSKVIDSGWFSMTPNLHIGRINPIQSNLTQFLSNLFKIIPSQKIADIILQMMMQLVFVANRG